MRHQVKTLIFKTLERLPRRVGDKIYHVMQAVRSKHTVDALVRDHLKTLQKFESALASCGLTLTEKTAGELGSGWLPVMPYHLLSAFHASRVYTYDINDHYSAARIEQLNRKFRNLDSVRFPEHLSGLHPDVIYHPRTDLSLSIPPEKIDAYLSRNVLEHVPPDAILAIHQAMRKNLSPNGFVVHQISPSDHRAYEDRSISLWDFLQYSQAEWDNIQTRFNYHNRLRLPQYLKIFDQAGFNVLHKRYSSEHDVSKMPATIHDDFRGFAIEELTAGNLHIILQPKP